MFNLVPTPTFSAPVPLSVPGLADPLEVRVTFRHKTREALAKWLADAGQRADGDMLHDVITEWTGMADEQGEPVPYSRTALETLLDNYPAARGELFAVYVSELSKSKRKNF
jgi:hypothetical protein